MRFNSIFIFIILASFTLTSCGILGKKDDIQRALEYKTGGKGCLNDFSKTLSTYFDGSISETEWKYTFDCTIDALDIFKQFVKGSSEEGYSQEDIHKLVSNFLVTDRTVTKELITATFALKASLLGGSKELLQKDELNNFMSFLRVARDSSLKVLPDLQARSRNPSGENLIKLYESMTGMGSTIGESLKTSANIALSMKEGEQLIDELSKMYKWNINNEWVAPFIAIKVFFLSGSDKIIEGKSWPDIFKLAGAFGGALTAALSAHTEDMHGPNEYGNFIVRLAYGIRPYLDQAIQSNNGVITYSTFNLMVDSIPKSIIDFDLNAIKETIPTVVQKVLRSGSKLGLDKNCFEILYSLLTEWNIGQTHLENIFETRHLNKVGAAQSEFVNAAKEYERTMNPNEVKDVERLIYLVQTFRPLFVQDDEMITFQKNTRYSLNNISKFHWMNMAGKLILKSYGSLNNGTRAVLSDVQVIIDDYKEILKAMHIFDTTIKNVAEKRFRDIDTFMFASNGDQTADINEVTYFLANMWSTSHLTDKIRGPSDNSGIEYKCKIGEKKDVLGWYWMDPNCFRQEFFMNFMEYWTNAPHLITYYNSLKTDADRRKFQDAMEIAARVYGKTELPIGGSDTGSFAGVIHYIETLFMKYDVINEDQTLETSEVLIAYWDFKQLMTKMGDHDPNDDDYWQAVFTYIVKFGHTPDVNIWEGLKFLLWWKPMRNLWYIHATRGDIYTIMSTVSPPDTPPTDPLFGL